MNPVTESPSPGEQLPARDSDATRGANSELALPLKQGVAAAVLDQAGALLIVLDTTGVIVHINHHCEQVSGYPGAEVLGKPFWDVFAVPEERDTIRHEFETLRKGALPAQYEHDFLTRDGVQRRITWSSTALTNAAGAVERLIATGIDVTELRRAEAACQASDAFNQSIIDNSKDCIKLLDLEGRLKFISEGGIRLLGIQDLSRYLEVSYELFWQGSDREATLAAIAAARDGQVGRFRGYCPTEDGIPKWWDVVISPILGADGSIERLLAISRDITEQHNVEEALRESEAKLEALFELLPIGISVLDAERHVVHDNAALHRVLQLSREDLQTGTHTTRTYLRADGTPMAPHEFPTVQAFAEQRPAHAQIGVLMQNGILIWTDVNAVPVPFSDWKVVATTSDITELKQAHEALRQSNEALEQRVLERTRSLKESNRRLEQEIEERRRIEQALRHHEETLEQRVEERTRDLATLLEISNAVALSQELQPLLNQILELLAEVVRYDGVTLYQLESDKLRVLLHHGPLDAATLERLALPIDRSSIAYELLAAQQPISIPDVREDSRAVQALRQVSGAQMDTTFGYVRAWLGLPLAINNQVVGLLTLQRREAVAFDERETRLAQAFAGQLAVALETARLHRQEQELAALEERQNLARELHDAVSQTLFSASLAAEVLPKLWVKDHELGMQCLGEVRQWTRGALAEMRTLLLELRPASLTQTDLAALLAQLAEGASSRARIPITVNATAPCPLPASVQITFYRIAQEALNNTTKHAQASKAAITLCCTLSVASTPGVALPTPAQPQSGGGATTCGAATVSRVEIAITDDGRGFNDGRDSDAGAHSKTSTGMGLGIMRERANAVGAELRVESAPGNGTRITVIWQPDAHRAAESQSGQ